MSALAFALLSALVLAPGVFAASSTAASTSFPGHVGGNAYAGYVKIPAGIAQVSVGPLFPVGLGCGVTATTVSASGATLNLGATAKGGATGDSVTTTRSTTSAGVQSNADTAGLNLLSGLITADAVHSVASTTANSSGATSTGSATFVNLVVAGVHVAASPTHNTKITLAGVGTVVLNEISGPVNKATESHITVIALDIRVTLANTLGLPVGAQVILGYATSSYQSTNSDSVLSSSSYGLYASGLSGGVTSGPWASATTPCTGGNTTNSVANTKLTGVLQTGTITDTATGNIGVSSTTASASSTVQGISLLGGLITGDAVTATASVDSGAVTATGTMTLTNLKVLGLPVSLTPKANLTIVLPGIGKVVINEQSLHPSATAASATENAIDVYVTQTNLLGIPTGARIIVGHAKVTVNNY